MLQTYLTDQVSSNVLTEIQEIEISSTISYESYKINFSGYTPGSGVSEIQEIKIIALDNGESLFRLQYNGVSTSTNNYKEPYRFNAKLSS